MRETVFERGIGDPQCRTMGCISGNLYSQSMAILVGQRDCIAEGGSCGQILVVLFASRVVIHMSGGTGY